MRRVSIAAVDWIGASGAAGVGALQYGVELAGSRSSEFIRRPGFEDCTVATAYCVNLNGDSLIPANAPIKIFERSYINPGTTTGANPNVMVYPNVVCAGVEYN